ncbi:MBL fold metallo-hydrolase [Shimia ponticola]|uniref:MBL fold metallo-hydrolase n=1 Tax=Shimia ponticola TaxID=2582893 RepID=UPI0011BF872A|nr:MBL fold metallo-hydrolase [Shimia ponticola]
MIKGRPTSLTILNFGQFMVHSGPRIIQLMGALIKTDQDEAIVVDTGMPAKYLSNPAEAGREDGLDSFGEVLQIGPENSVEQQLAQCGVSQVKLLILTHGHIDHVGGIDAFKGVPIMMGKPERDMPRPSYFGDTQPMEWPKGQYLTVEQDTGLGPDLDLFFTPGHAPGQLALGVTLAGVGRVIWASDAISRESEPDEGFTDAWDPELALHHAKRLLDMPHDHLIYGHDPDQRLQIPFAPIPIT